MGIQEIPVDSPDDPAAFAASESGSSPGISIENEGVSSPLGKSDESLKDPELAATCDPWGMAEAISAADSTV
jgi:hypothetical protein